MNIGESPLQLYQIRFNQRTRQVISHCASNSDGDNIPNLRLAFHKDHSIDLRRIAVRPADGNTVIESFDQHIQRFANVGLIHLKRNVLLQFHQAFESLLFNSGIYRVAQRRGGCPRLEGKLKSPNAVKSNFLHEIIQGLKFLVRLAGVSNDERGTHGQVFTVSRIFPMVLYTQSILDGRFMRYRVFGCACWSGISR